METKKKRDHYIPKSYLKSFCGKNGKVHVYLKDKPNKYIHQSPNNVGFHKYYYSQPLLNGKRDYNKLENFFSKLESRWPSLILRMQRREDINDGLGVVFNFMALQRVRVPAMRDACEKLAAETVMSELRVLDARGELPPAPEGLENIFSHMEVAIDPHKSIHAMPDLLRGIGRMFGQIGIGALRNMTNMPFLTSDNPVIWFDPSVPEDEMQPYVLKKDAPVVLLFPVAPNLMIYGHSSMREQFSSDGFCYGELSELKSVEMMNRQVCKFAYKTVFAQETGQESMIHEHSNLSPILEISRISAEQGEIICSQFIFGPRKRKPKWAKADTRTCG